MDPVVAVAVWMIIWWISEAVAIPVTALLPMALFPIFGVMDIGSVTGNYANPIVYLFFGGFVIALALEKVQLHKRIALSILKLTGTRANGIVLGFMLATALMSMWISNTASTVVMLPIAVSVISLLMNDADGFTKKDQKLLSILIGFRTDELNLQTPSRGSQSLGFQNFDKSRACTNPFICRRSIDVLEFLTS